MCWSRRGVARGVSYAIFGGRVVVGTGHTMQGILTEVCGTLLSARSDCSVVPKEEVC
jgi:hypothetical protein